MTRKVKHYKDYTEKDWEKAEEVQNLVIEMLRTFSERNWHNFTTGFQRMIAKQIIHTAIEQYPGETDESN